MDELFNPQSSSVQSSRILYTPSSFARTSLLHLQEVGSLQATHSHTSTRTDLVSFLCFVVLSGKSSLKYEGVNYELGAREIAYSLTAGKRTAILHPIIFGRSSGATSMRHPFRLCMRNTRSVVAGLCFIQMI